ncbi:MAG: RpiB/LacA/LacB family sugar-phosphate isomerase [Clostridiales Family XIII bacterium]|jgi:ribose 5-phosphate isomerase B|nr:RpiB/LacA/LacB family sugar-phosphate isomerase [Clostridiales Family XIII bacterium]
MKIVLASDHGGYRLKEDVKKALSARSDTEVVDLGTDSEESVDYPVFGEAAGKYVASGKAERGIVFCGTGMGITIAANKVKGIRCANITSEAFAALAAEHNHANIIAFGGRFIAPEDALHFIDVWLTTKWAGDRHERRVGELDEML